DRKPKLSEHVASTLKAQILSGEIRAGDKLPTESQLTETFGVSRTVVREAVASLSAVGLAESRQGAGIFVCDRPAMAFASFSQYIGAKVSHGLKVIEVRMGLDIESAALAAVRRNAAQEAVIQEAFFEFNHLLSACEATGDSDFLLPRCIASATYKPFYVEV